MSPIEPAEVPSDVARLAEEIAERTGAVRERLDRVAGRDVSLLAVTKGHPPSVAWAAALAGHVDLGENYAQELAAKAEFLAERGAEVRWHMIGPVQSNKVKLLAPLLGWWHTIDRPKLVRAIAARSPGATVLVQRNLSGDPGKAGCAAEAVEPLVELAVAEGLDVAGLMGVATEGSLDRAAVEFASLVAQADDLGLRERCIGMSADLDVALSAGATMVRLGSMLFGSRPGSANGGPSRA
ncbi:MAG: YggS family pyridoxal phosphate-dependent enzyme [Microthrixaceae bacterium]|nr:YggS family pyridoxal phosphate-dependent enzyme [Microthrixaceae bacterium]